MRPFIPPEEEKPVDPRAEFTLRAIVTGTALGLVFGASSLYLVLKVGLTVIPGQVSHAQSGTESPRLCCPFPLPSAGDSR